MRSISSSSDRPDFRTSRFDRPHRWPPDTSNTLFSDVFEGGKYSNPTSSPSLSRTQNEISRSRLPTSCSEDGFESPLPTRTTEPDTCILSLRNRRVVPRYQATVRRHNLFIRSRQVKVPSVSTLKEPLVFCRRTFRVLPE